MKSSKWPDFLFALAVRFICGIVLGCLACFLVSYRGILRAFAHNDTRGPLLWLAFCGLAGGIIAAFKVPHWKTPWYKGIRGRNDDDDDV
jgi:hypothetical protein